MIDSPVLERVLSEALRHGGDFAEVFAEDRSTSSAMLDDGRVEELSSGRERGAGIRVVSGETTGFAHTADLTSRACCERLKQLLPWPVGVGGTGTVAVGPLGAGPATGEGRDGSAHRSLGSKADSLELLSRADEAARASGERHLTGAGRLRDSRRRVLIANSEGCWPGTTRSGPGSRHVRGYRGHRNADRLRVGGPHDRFRSVRRDVGRRGGPGGRQTGPRQALARPAPSGVIPVVLAVAPAASSSTRPAATGSRRTTS